MSVQDGGGRGGGGWPTSHLTVTILQARRLRAKNHQGNGSNPYIQVRLGCQSFTTQPVPNSLCPAWNSTMTFALPQQRDNALAVTITVMHKQTRPLLPDRFLGRAEVPVVDVCQDHQLVYRKWLTLESKPKKKAKDRGEMEVCLRLESLHSHTTTTTTTAITTAPSQSQSQSQSPSICPARDGGWGGAELTAVQTAKCEPIQPSCAVVPELDRTAPPWPSVCVDTHEPVASSSQCVSSSGSSRGHGAPELDEAALSDRSGFNDTPAEPQFEEAAGNIKKDDKAGDSATQINVKDDAPVATNDANEVDSPVGNESVEEDSGLVDLEDKTENCELLLIKDMKQEGSLAAENNAKQDGNSMSKKDEKEVNSAVKTMDGKEADSPKDASEDSWPVAASHCYASISTQTSTPPPSPPATNPFSKLLPRLGYLRRHLGYRWGSQGDSAETQPLHPAPQTTSTIPESSRPNVSGHGYFFTIFQRLHALCVWVDEYMGNVREGEIVTL
ncbi:uncharacterized protein LOC134439598 isoform X3 [Engraulis encrasicolus]|uniref:uncharacterized protein LOC134439598 isoform X3 n=1 Tax=Engraulis encrasicolus TaxID=184585 RepID=UPI002FD05288